MSVSLSFTVRAPITRCSPGLYDRSAPVLSRDEVRKHHPDEQPLSLGDTRVLIMGMGRTGTAAYDWLIDDQPKLMGLDSDPAKAQQHQKEGRNVVFADAEDASFWNGLHMPAVQSVILAMGDIEGKLIAARMLRKLGFKGFIVAHTMDEDEAKQIREAGAHAA